MIFQYNAKTPYHVKNLFLIIPKRILIQGFIVRDHFKDYYEPFQKDMLQWLKEYTLKYKEHIVEGIENSPKAFLDVFEGKNFGKLVVKIGDL